MTEQDLNDVIAGFREALRDYVKGDPEPAMSFFSNRDDVTLANPLEPPRRGPAEVGEAARRAAANFRVGGPVHFEEVPAASRKSPGSPPQSSAISCRSSGTRAGSPATTTRSSPCCAPRWCSGMRTACGRSPTATPTRSLYATADHHPPVLRPGARVNITRTRSSVPATVRTSDSIDRTFDRAPHSTRAPTPLAQRPPHKEQTCHRGNHRIRVIIFAVSSARPTRDGSLRRSAAHTHAGLSESNTSEAAGVRHSR